MVRKNNNNKKKKDWNTSPMILWSRNVNQFIYSKTKLEYKVVENAVQMLSCVNFTGSAWFILWPCFSSAALMYSYYRHNRNKTCIYFFILFI